MMVAISFLIFRRSKSNWKSSLTYNLMDHFTHLKPSSLFEKPNHIFVVPYTLNPLSSTISGAMQCKRLNFSYTKPHSIYRCFFVNYFLPIHLPTQYVTFRAVKEVSIEAVEKPSCLRRKIWKMISACVCQYEQMHHLVDESTGVPLLFHYFSM